MHPWIGCAHSISKAKQGIRSSLYFRSGDSLFLLCFHAPELLGANTHHSNPFLFMANKSSFLKFVFLYNIQKKKKKVAGLILRRKIGVNWYQGKLFLDYFFCISAVAKDTNLIACPSNFPGGWQGAKPEVQSIGIRECHVFIYVKFFCKESWLQLIFSKVHYADF